MEETSKKVRHTPAPWKANALYSRVVTNDKEICQISVNENDEAFSFEEWRANAFLIASAPQLLEALEGVVKAFVESHEKYADWSATKEVFEAYMKSLEAIKLAKGEIKTELI